MYKILLTIFLALIALMNAIWVYRKMRPLIEISVTPRWDNEKKDFIIFRLKAINRSSVLAKPVAIRFQILEHNFEDQRFLPNFIPFSEEEFNKRGKDENTAKLQAIKWEDPFDLDCPKKMEPGENVFTEILHQRVRDCDALHYGYQVEWKLSWLARILYKGIPARSGEIKRKTDSLTTTGWIGVPKSLKTDG